MEGARGHVCEACRRVKPPAEFGYRALYALGAPVALALRSECRECRRRRLALRGLKGGGA